MWLWMVLLLWVPVGGQVDLTKAAITLQPPWVNVFQGEQVTLQCEGTQLPGNSSTTWFLNGTAFQTLTPSYSILADDGRDSGEYRCQTGLSVPSDPVWLEIHRDWLLLQVSGRVITEGEPLALRCHGWKNKRVYNMVFYRNGNAFKFSPRVAEFTIQRTNVSHDGTYHCSGMGRHRYASRGVSVTVKELFTTPVLRASLSLPLLEGNPVNLSCETQLLLQMPALRLYFSFYVGNKALMERNLSSEYRIVTVSSKDSGLYRCEVATEDGNVLKRSPELELQVIGSQPPVWFHILFYLAVGIMFVVSTVLGVTIYKALQRKRSWNLEMSLASEGEKRLTAYHQKDERVEEVKGLEQDEQLQEDAKQQKL